jgi:hypothetical protein
MSQKLWNWAIALGALVCMTGLLFLPSALSGHGTDEGTLGAGGAIFGLGAIIVSVSLYFKTSAVRAEIAANPQLAVLLAGKRPKGNCGQCGEATAVIQCTMHKQSLCASCLVQHYESRACVYVPAVRKAANRNARGASAART